MVYYVKDWWLGFSRKELVVVGFVMTSGDELVVVRSLDFWAGVGGGDLWIEKYKG